MTTTHTLLGPVPKHASFLTFDLRPGANAQEGLATVAKQFPTATGVLGVGLPLSLALGARLQHLRAFPAIAGPGLSMPSTQGALWMMLGGANASEVFDASRVLHAAASPAFALREEVQAFEYRGGRDLTGYEDGTENPTGDKALATAIIDGLGKGYDGGSFVAVQRYVHDLASFAKLPQTERDHVIGRHHETNEELPMAPASAHVKRAAQESFEEGGFMLRRSMPWGNSQEHGLYFVAYGHSLDAYERVLTRMAGLEDGVVDSLLRITRAMTGGYYFCPPMQGTALDLSALQAAP